MNQLMLYMVEEFVKKTTYHYKGELDMGVKTS